MIWIMPDLAALFAMFAGPVRHYPRPGYTIASYLQCRDRLGRELKKGQQGG